jgi:hyaluronoglucosaminidase
MLWNRHRMLSAVASVALCAAVVAATGQSRAATAPDALPPVYPVPQSMVAHGTGIGLGASVALVTDTDTDQAAIDAVTQVMHDHSVEVDTGGSVLPGETRLYLGQGGAAASALQQLGVQDASGLRAEGYVLADGTIGGHNAVVLDGHDGSGTFYAVQTLRQLITGRSVAGVEVRDWPDQALRGTIEGFYGTPWSDAQRLRQMDFYGAHKMNIYVYSPKNDPYLRDQWRDPYPPAQLQVLQTLVQRATANHVEFTYALSPGLSVCYSSAADEQALVAKFQSLWDIGVRSYSIPLDDISYTNWNCAADQAKFGTGGGAAGAAQSYLLNEVQRDFIATHPGAQRLQMVPTEYSDVANSAYKTAIRNDLDPAVVVGWTGVGVIATTITTAQAAQAKAVYGHDILLWDNYPVNDYVTDRLLLGPYTGRASGLAGSLYGITANPMIEPEASKIALFNVGDYTWNGAAYDPDTSWQASLTELAGSDPQARRALAAFADLEYYSQLNPTQAPVLASKVAAFWPGWEHGDTSAAGTLDGYLRIIQTAGTTLSQRMNDPEFVDEAQPWLQSASAWGSAARTALTMLADERGGNGAAALADRAQVEAQVTQAKSYTYVGLNGTVHVTVGDGVIDKFIADALAENDRWLGLAGRHVTATTSMATYQSYVPANMVDGDTSTWYWSNRSPAPGDYVGVDLGATQPISSVKIQAGDAASPNDYIHVGTLEYSSDGSTWTTIATYVNQANISVTLPAGTQARYVRMRATQSDGYWVKVHEFTVSGPGNAAITVSGTPAAASGSSLAAAADGNADTTYRAANAPADGDALVATLPKARPLDRVAVIGTGGATVQVQTADGWQDIGTLSSTGYTELDAGGRTASAVRLAWQAGSAAPTIGEIVPWYADAPAADLAVAPASIDTSVNQPQSVTAQLTATQPRDVSGTLSVSAPAAVTADPASSTTTLYRGAQQTTQIALQSPQPGTYQVTVSFTPAGGSALTEQVEFVVHPAVSSTNVAAAAQGGTATASSVEQNLPQFTPDHAIDGDASTRWSSNYTDGEWLQVKFAQPENLGKIVISWEAAHATSYRLETSTDGTTWTTARTVTGSLGGTETEWVDVSGVQYLRMQGVARATQYGYSIYELQAYPLA